MISNIDGGAAYSKWIGDLVDTQVYDNRSDTFNTHMAMPGQLGRPWCAPLPLFCARPVAHLSYSTPTNP